MPRTLYDSPYIFGLHDPGGEYIMAEAGRRGWIVFTEAVGSDPNDISGKNFRPWSDQGFGIICRINNGYGSGGTIPVSSRYPDFARRVANYVAASRGCKIWIIGNEPNHAQERPQLPSGAMEVITPSMYAQCYRLCRDAMRAVPGHADDQVLVAAVAPWNVQTTYPTNPDGNWIVYFGDILRLVEPTGCDGIALHTYTHGSDPALVVSRATMNPPFQNYYFNFLAYQDFMAAIPNAMRALPVYITESNQDVPWLDQNNGWVKAAYAEINRWNQVPGTQKIRSLALYRWPRFDQWYIEGKQGVIADFREAMQNNYRWEPAVLKPANWKPGARVRTLEVVNFRVAPAGATIGQVPRDAYLLVLGGYQLVDNIPYWPVTGTVDGMPRDGWVAQYTQSGIELLEAAPPEPLLPGIPAPSNFKAGDMLQATDAVNFRSSPGGPVLGVLAPETVVTVRGEPYVVAGGLPYWPVRGPLAGAPADGWVAEYAPNGAALLRRYRPTQPPPPPPPGEGIQRGDRIRTLDWINIRRTAGSTNKPADDVVAVAPPDSILIVAGGPTLADKMKWWRATGTLADGRRVDGWLAEALPDGTPLVVEEVAGTPAPAPAAPSPAVPGGTVPTPPRPGFQLGDRVRTTTIVNMRRSPGTAGKPATDIIAQIPAGTEGTLVDGPLARDEMRWWLVQLVDPTLGRLAGWMAERLPDGTELFEEIVGGTTPPILLEPGDLVAARDFVRVRRTPGYSGKPESDTLGVFLPDTALLLLGDSVVADGLAWWPVAGILVPGGSVSGYVAQTSPDGVELIGEAVRLPGTTIPTKLTGRYLRAPFPGTFGISQLWGENPDFYSQFSYDGAPLQGHNGIDFLTPPGTPVFAVADGVVQRAEFEDGGFGHFVLLRHPWGESIYAHLDRRDVSAGQTVTAGQQIGVSGNSGGSTGPHLHHAIRIDPYLRTDGWGGFNDPLPYLPPDSFQLPGYLTGAGVRGALAARAGARAPLQPPSMGDVPSEARP
jgi:hypothetical protein